MNLAISIGLNLAAIIILTFGLYLRRHHRRDLTVSYVGIKIGVFAVAAVLSGSQVGIGLGIALFGVLSIIRLRSNELEQHEIAYYFSALAIGLICGLGPVPLWLPIVLVALILLAMFVADHSRVLASYRHQQIVLDQTISDEAQLHAYLSEALGGAKIKQAIVQQLDLVNDKTTATVRYVAPLKLSSSSRNVLNHEVILEETR